MLDNGNLEPKKEKNAKHGIIAMAAMIIAIVLIIIGAYLFSSHRASDNRPASNVISVPSSSSNE